MESYSAVMSDPELFVPGDLREIPPTQTGMGLDSDGPAFHWKGIYVRLDDTGTPIRACVDGIDDFSDNWSFPVSNKRAMELAFELPTALIEEHLDDWRHKQRKECDDLPNGPEDCDDWRNC